MRKRPCFLKEEKVQPRINGAELFSSFTFVRPRHRLDLLAYALAELFGGEDVELAAVAEDGVEEVVGGIAADGEERGVGRVLALRGVEGLGEEVVGLGACCAEADEGHLARAVVDASWRTFSRSALIQQP